MAELLDDGRHWSTKRWKVVLRDYAEKIDSFSDAINFGDYDRHTQYLAETALYEMRIFFPSAQNHCPRNIPDWKTRCSCRAFVRLTEKFEEFILEADRMLEKGYQQSML